uniref:Retrovirus-related Pol polyprotein from transposon TNT 1-94-like beta-barrel domain-containing protein n=1 Tax=Fagus sylvatica TaxID=28930 RepID=A0A2N9HEI0_FAGSY
MEDAEWALLDRQVLGVIRLTLSRSVAHNVVKETTTVGLMTALSESVAVAKHLNEFNTITNQLSFVEIEFDDEIRALIVLASLPNSWEAMRMAVSNSAGKGKLKYDDIRDLILSEEVRKRDAGIEMQNVKLLSQRTEDHIRMNCRHWRKEQIEDKDQKHDDEKDTTTIVDDEEVVMLLVQEQKCEHVDNNDDEWVVDSAATHHVVRTKELFTTYKAENFGTVKMGNTSYSKIVGTGDAIEDGNLPKDLWLLQDGVFAAVVQTRVKACKKKFNAVGTIEKTPQLRVMSVAPKRVKFSLPDSATNGGAICDEECRDGKLATCDDDEVKDSKDLEQGERAPTLEMVEPYEKRSTTECQKDSSKNI